MDLSFPIKDHLQEETFNELLEAARHFNTSRFTKAQEVLTDLLSKVENSTQDSTLINRAILTHWCAKVSFATGDFLKAYQHA